MPIRFISRSVAAVVLIAATSSFGEEPIRRTIGPMIKVGDPDVVPIVLRRLREVAAKPLDASQSHPEFSSELLNAISDCSMYQLDEAGPQMVRAYRAMPGPNVGSIPYLVASASRYHSAAARAFQWTLLDDPRVADDYLRTQLLSALAEGGDDRAIETLGEFVETQLHRIARGASATGELEQAIPRTPSASLRARIDRIVPIGDEGADHTLATLKERFAFNALPPAQLMDRIERAPAIGVIDVNNALVMLGKVGTLTDLPRIKALSIGEPGHDKGRMRAERDNAVASIRRRYWRELSGPATQPATTEATQ